MDWAEIAVIAQAILYVVLVAYWIGVVIVIVGEDRPPTTSLAWLLFLIVFPVIGLIFYFFLGRNWKLIYENNPENWARVKLLDEFMTPIYERNRADVERLAGPYLNTWFVSIGRSIRRTNDAAPLPVKTLEIFPSGGEKYDRLLPELATAQDSIHMAYFIWEQDELSKKITDILHERLKAGVEVRIMNDYIGNFQYKKDELKSLKHAGAEYESDIKDLGRANYRNHRKMVIIDGHIGYTGGINVGQEYIDGGERFPVWRDTHMRYAGQGVAELQKLFGVRWLEVTGESIFADKYFPAPDPPGEQGDILTQTVAQGVDDPWESARRAHMVAIANAKEHAWIQSPYFIPDQGLYDVMVNAALGGIDIQLMMPGKWLDKGLPFYAAESYFKQFLQAGGKILIYQDGFLHSKTLSVDSKVLAIGTMNLDIRALQLHKELMVWIYNEELTRRHEAIFAHDRDRCEEVTLLDVEGWSKGHRFRNSAARLASNLL